VKFNFKKIKKIERRKTLKINEKFSRYRKIERKIKLKNKNKIL